MAPVPAGFQQVTFLFGGSFLPHGAACTLGYEGLAGDGHEIVEGIRDEAETLVDILSSSGVELQGVELKYGPSASGPTYTATSAMPGGQGSDSDAPNTAYLFRKTVSTVSGRLMGRLYWPGVPATVTNGAGFLAPATVTTANEAWADFIDNIATSFSGQPMVFSASASDPRPVSGVVCQAQVATQRRRLRR